MSNVSIERDKSLHIFKAYDLLQRAKDGIAKRKRKKRKQVIGLTNFLVNSPTLYLQEEIHLFTRAAEAFRICQKWMDAAESYSHAGWLLGYDLKKKEEGAILYTEAGLCAKRFGIEKGEKYFSKSEIRKIELIDLWYRTILNLCHMIQELAISLYCDCEKYDQAGRIRFWIAKGYEETNQLNSAIDEYRLTAKYFKADGMNESVLRCERKIAQMLAVTGANEEASKQYKAIGFKVLRQNLTKYSSFQYFFQSSILLFADALKSGSVFDFSKVYDNIKHISETDYRFEVSAHCDFLYNMMNVLKNEKGTLDEFIDHLYDYISLYPLEIWGLDIMQRVMQHRFQGLIQSMMEDELKRT